MVIVLNPDAMALSMRRRTSPVHDSKPVGPEIPPSGPQK